MADQQLDGDPIPDIMPAAMLVGVLEANRAWAVDFVQTLKLCEARPDFIEAVETVVAKLDIAIVIALSHPPLRTPDA